MKRVSLLTAAAAGVSVGALLVASVVAGVVSGGPAATFLVLAAVASAVGLAVGWRPALAVAPALGVLAAVPLAAAPAHWVALAVVGGAVVLSQESGRVSFDLRRPARLGPGVGRSLAARTAALVAVAPVVAVALAAVAGRVHGSWLVPAALVAAALPVAVPRVAGLARGVGANPTSGADPARRGDRPPAPRGLDRLGTGGRLALAGLAALIVLSLAGAAATARRDEPAAVSTPTTERVRPQRATATTLPPTDVAPTTDAPPPSTRGGLTVILLISLVSAVIVLLLSGLRRNRIALVQEAIELEAEEPGLDVIRSSAADLDDEAVALSEEVAAELVGEITVDLRSEPDPGRAVRYAYARMERRLAVRGIERRPWESEPELLTRALGALGAEGSALAELTALFERARFSDAPVPEAMRTAAIAALDRLRPDREGAR